MFSEMFENDSKELLQNNCLSQIQNKYFHVIFQLEGSFLSRKINLHLSTTLVSRLVTAVY